MEKEYRDFKIVPDGKFGNKVIRNMGSGRLADTLKGQYTSFSFAQKAIDRHLKAIKGVKNARTPKGTSTSASRG